MTTQKYYTICDYLEIGYKQNYAYSFSKNYGTKTIMRTIFTEPKGSSANKYTKRTRESVCYQL